MSFLNKAKEQAQKTMGGSVTTNTNISKPGIPNKPGIPKPPTSSKPGIPGKPIAPKPGIPTKPNVPAKPKEETPLEAKSNPFLKVPDINNASIPIPSEPLEKDAEMMKPIEEAKAEVKASKEEVPAVEEVKKEVVVEDKKEEVKDTKKKSSNKKKSTAKSKDASTEDVGAIEPMEIPATELEYAEAMVSIKSNFVDPEWEAFREEIIQQLNEINISSDMTPSALKETISNLSAVRESIWVQYNDTKTAFEKLTAKEPEGLIERIKKLNASGSNAEERKVNAILAVMNYKDGAGRNINLFELLDETRERYNFLKSVMESSQYKTNVLVTMLGSLKLEK